MATNLYETLEIPRDAAPEEIRKAYKRKALQTHPDRLPPTATQSEKQASEEQFRKVNNAYEILNDPENRKIYDRHGVFPPPEPQYDPPSASSHHRYRSPHRANTFPDPFFHPDLHEFAFRDPFELFDEIFAGMTGGFGGRSGSYWPESPAAQFHSRFGSMLAAMERDMLSDFGHADFGPPGFGFPTRSLLTPGFGTFPGIGGPSGGGGFASESFSSQTINGVTQTVHKRREWDGTRHEFRTYPDGRQVHTINGIEQPNPPLDSRFLPPPNVPPNTPITPVRTSSRHQKNNYVSPPPSYHSTPPVVPQEIHRHHRTHSQASSYNEGPIYPYARQKRHWWSRH